MKKMILLALILSPFLANANPAELLNCSTPGDALEAVSVGVNTIGDDSDTVYLTMTNAEPSVVGSFTANLQKGSIQKDFTAGTIEVTLTSDKSIEFGGMKTDAAYLNVKKVDGNFSGTLAAKGNVYTLRCY